MDVNNPEGALIWLVILTPLIAIGGVYALFNGIGHMLGLN